MAISVRTQKILDEVKMGLSILYGADYFTEDEWIKLDYLMHKGKYVFTHGPATTNVDEEPLMTFDDPQEDEKLEDHAQTFQSSQAQPPMAPQYEVPSSPSPGDSVEPHTETPRETSPEFSSDEASNSPPSSSVPTKFDLSVATTPISSAPAKSTVIDGLKAGYTKEQLEEVRAFNAGLTKAGQKKRPKYDPVEEDHPPSNWAEETTEITKPSELYPSPAPTERAARINSWASDVDAAEANGRLNIAAPTPNPNGSPALVLLDEFIKAHGKEPKCMNDVYQPNNPQHHKRSESRASVKTVKTTKSATQSIVQDSPSTASAHPLPKLQVPYGTILRAKRSSPKKSMVDIEVQEGDQIKVLKWVSGIMHTGENGRTKQRGQFPNWIFKAPLRSSAPPAQQTKFEHQRGFSEQPTAQSWGTDREEIEKTRTWDNAEVGKAAQWDDIPFRHTKKQVTPAPVVKPSGGGLSASRFSLLEDEGAVKPVQQITPAMEKEFGKIINRKVDEILKLRGMQSTPAPQPRIPVRPLKQSSNEPSLTVPLKTEVCWFWKTPNRDCRFTAEECRDLHTLNGAPPADHYPQNLRSGRPTWGAAADYSPPTPTGPSASISIAADDTRYKAKTCYYWAVEGKCNYASDECKYVHEHTGSGIAPRPSWKMPRHWGMDNWKKNDVDVSPAGGAGDDDDGEFVIDEVVGTSSWGAVGADSGWGESAGSWGDDKYKPPHVVALENKARQQVLSW